MNWDSLQVYGRSDELRLIEDVWRKRWTETNSRWMEEVMNWDSLKVYGGSDELRLIEGVWRKWWNEIKCRCVEEVMNWDSSKVCGGSDEVRLIEGVAMEEVKVYGGNDELRLITDVYGWIDELLMFVYNIQHYLLVVHFFKNICFSRFWLVLQTIIDQSNKCFFLVNFISICLQCMIYFQVACRYWKNLLIKILIYSMRAKQDFEFYTECISFMCFNSTWIDWLQRRWVCID